MTATAPGTKVAHYLLDKSASRFTVRAFATGMLASMGHNPTIEIRDFSGEAIFDPAVPETVSLKVQIRADSLEVMDEMKSKDRKEMESLMNQKVLESSKYPLIVYESKQASMDDLGDGRYRVVINGSLSLHGVTRDVPVTAQVSVTADTAKAYGEFSILQSNFGIPLFSAAGGALRLKDELKFTFDILARQHA